MSDEVCFRVRESGPCRDACNLLCLAEDSIFPKDSGARAITKRDSFCMSSVALGSSEEFIGRCEGRISKSRSQGARPPGSAPGFSSYVGDLSLPLGLALSPLSLGLENRLPLTSGVRHLSPAQL